MQFLEEAIGAGAIRVGTAVPQVAVEIHALEPAGTHGGADAMAKGELLAVGEGRLVAILAVGAVGALALEVEVVAEFALLLDAELEAGLGGGVGLGELVVDAAVVGVVEDGLALGEGLGGGDADVFALGGAADGGPGGGGGG